MVVLNKIDLLPYTDFDLNALTGPQLVNPQIRVFQLSGRTGEGLAQWIEWLVEEVESELFSDQ